LKPAAQLPESRKARQLVVLIAIILAAGAFCAFLPVVKLDFTNYDDPDYLTENPAVKAGLTLRGLIWAFSSFHSGNWHPMTWLSHMLDCTIFGLNAAGHHFTNVIIHTANSVVLFILLRSLTGALWRSALVAALFALHPLHVESVAWVSERKDVLSTFFGLLAIWAYTGYVRNLGSSARGTACYALALFAFALSLMSKAMLVTLPFVLLLLDYWPCGRLLFGKPGKSRTPDRRVILEKLPFFALSAVLCVITFLAQKSAGAIAPLEEIPFGARVTNAVVAYNRYLFKIVWPTNLAVIYPVQLNWGVLTIVASVMVLAGITTMALWQLRRRPYLMFGWVWFVGTLVPVIGLVQVGNQSMADRYTYFPSVGLFLMISWGLGELVLNRATLQGQAWIPGLVAGLMVLGCVALTEGQLRHWRNTETLFRHAVEVTRNNFVAYNSLGFCYSDRHEIGPAETCFRAAVAINPGNPFSWSGLARVSLQREDYDEAIANCQAALVRNPRLAEAHATLGQALVKKGEINQAISHYTEALQLRPDQASTHYNLANALAVSGQITDACQHYQESLRLEPRSADAHNNLAYMFVREGKLSEAIVEFQAALSLQPGLWQGRFGLADALARQGKTREAVAEYREVLRCRPDFVEALNRLAWILAVSPEPEIRNGTEAVLSAKKACHLTDYKQPMIVLSLAAAYAEAGQFSEAISAAETARNVALAAGKTEAAEKIQQLLQVFRSGQPYHEPRTLSGQQQ